MSPLPVKLNHLERITDDTGLLEHCIGKVPRRREGYAADDNARALWCCTEWIQYAKTVGDPDVLPQLKCLIDTYLSFLAWVQGPDGRFHNDVSYTRQFEPEIPSDDCQGRALWATAMAALRLDGEQATMAEHLCHDGFRALPREHPRGVAHALAAASLLVRDAPLRTTYGSRLPSRWFSDWVETDLPSVILQLSEALLERFERHSGPRWLWLEPTMTYSNGVFPWSLWLANSAIPSPQTEHVARATLDFLVDRMTAPEGHLRPIGNQEWCTPSGQSRWDQQPIEVMKLAAACAEGYRNCRNTRYLTVLGQCTAWFQGQNDKSAVMADSMDGSCSDGLTAHGPSDNCGAESTLSFLLTEAIRHNLLAHRADEHNEFHPAYASGEDACVS